VDPDRRLRYTLTAMATNSELVRSVLDAYFSGDDAALLDRLAADAQWPWHQPSDHDCHGPEVVLDPLAGHRRQRILTGVIDARDGANDRVLVRWSGQRMHRRFGVPDGAAPIVVSSKAAPLMRAARDQRPPPRDVVRPPR
jgi:hypothetical protein